MIYEIDREMKLILTEDKCCKKVKNLCIFFVGNIPILEYIITIILIASKWNNDTSRYFLRFFKKFSPLE